jgi:hypothetical protein
MTTFTDKLAGICFDERARFDNGAGKEYDPPYSDYVGEYWVSIGITNLKGNTVQGGIRPAWSSAFVSFCVRKAGAGSKFKYAQAHCHYIDAAMKAAETAGSNYGYLARKPEDYAPKVGDIVCAGREYAKSYTFDMAKMVYLADSFYPSHGDIVVKKNADSVEVIGGNLGESVKRKVLALNSAGKLKKLTPGGVERPWVAVLECRL